MINCPIPGARGTCEVEGTGANGVLILGEAMGEEEAKDGRPFRPWAPAGAVLERAIRRAGFQRASFALYNIVPTHPPNDYLVGAPYEHEAIAWGLEYVRAVVERLKPRVILALGGTALRATTGLAGPKLGVSNLAGFLLPGVIASVPVIASFHPSYIRRGNMTHLGLLIDALRRAVTAARTNAQPQTANPSQPPKGYCLYPSERDAADFHGAVRSGAWPYLAYDIETAYSVDEDSAEEREGEIQSIQFSLAPNAGIFMPWRPPFIEIARSILALPIPKLGWNNYRFDDPRLRESRIEIAGVLHDLMWAWHHSQPDIPRNLQFAAAQQGWNWPWKHLSEAAPEFYGIVDVDVLQFMVSNEKARA